MFCAAFEGLLRGDKARSRSFFVAIEFSFSEIWTVQIEENVSSLKTKNKLRALITE